MDDKNENSTEFGGDFLHGTINVKIPVFTIRRHGGTFFHGRGEFRVSELCLLSPDDTHGCQVRIHGPPPNDFARGRIKGMGLDRKDRGQDENVGWRGEFSEDWANTESFLLLFVVVVTEASFLAK